MGQKNEDFEKNKMFIIYSINTYASANEKFINENKIIIKDIQEIIKKLENDKGYHFRIHENKQYIFFGDLDNYKENINQFMKLLMKFLEKKYGISFDKKDFYYTQNSENINSYHYSIPKFNLSTSKLKEIHTNLLKEYANEFIYKNDKNITKKCIDTTIYSEHWFRCPNQKKGTSEKNTSKHIIKKGDMINFIIDYIPYDSININDIEFIKSKEKNTNENNNLIIKEKQQYNEIVKYDEKKDFSLSTTMKHPTIYKKMFDDCYKQERFDVYEYWISIGMAIRNTFDNDEIAFDLFNYFSSKGNNYDGIDITKKKFKTFIAKRSDNKFTIATIYYYAIEDNKPKFIEIMKKNTFNLEQNDMCNYIKLLAGKQFIYTKVNGIYKLFCFDGKVWKDDDILFKKFI